VVRGIEWYMLIIPAVLEAEAGGLRVQGQIGLCGETAFQK
jgi:hypothetical protein